jgi:hypothetical protein
MIVYVRRCSTYKLSIKESHQKQAYLNKIGLIDSLPYCSWHLEVSDQT